MIRNKKLISTWKPYKKLTNLLKTVVKSSKQYVRFIILYYRLNNQVEDEFE